VLARLEARPSRAPAVAAQVAAGLRAMLADARPEPAPELLVTRAAGLVLLAPWLPTLFARLELADGSEFRGPEAVDRAMDALHAALHGERAAGADGRPLERLLCGLSPDRPLRQPLPLAPDQAAVIEDLLGAVIARWAALGRTSVAGLREAFLQREGLVKPGEAAVGLEVAPRAYDMLLDRLPWSIAVIKLPWMSAAIHVKWRK
jgi:hypothetical protein